jgi:hypothetical protein
MPAVSTSGKKINSSKGRKELSQKSSLVSVDSEFDEKVLCACGALLALRETKKEPSYEYYSCANRKWDAEEKDFLGGCTEWWKKVDEEHPLMFCTLCCRFCKFSKSCPNIACEPDSEIKAVREKKIKCRCDRHARVHRTKKHSDGNNFVFLKCGKSIRAKNGEWKNGCRFYRKATEEELKA